MRCSPLPCYRHSEQYFLPTARLVQQINEQGAVAGIKVDTGIAALPGADDEGYTMGLNGLRERCQAYYKWRAVLRIDSNFDSGYAGYLDAAG